MMRVAARAYRPRVASTAYGKAIGLPSDRPIPRCTETPYFAGPRYCWDHAKIYDLSIRYQHHDSSSASSSNSRDRRQSQRCCRGFRRQRSEQGDAAPGCKYHPILHTCTFAAHSDHARERYSLNRHTDLESRLVPAAIVNPLGG